MVPCTTSRQAFCFRSRESPEPWTVENPDDRFPEDVLSPTDRGHHGGGEPGEGLPALRAHGAAVTTHFHRGTPSPPYWERELRGALPALLRTLGR